MLSAAASLGTILLWDVDGGLTQIDKYLYSSEDYIKVSGADPSLSFSAPWGGLCARGCPWRGWVPGVPGLGAAHSRVEELLGNPWSIFGVLFSQSCELSAAELAPAWRCSLGTS